MLASWYFEILLTFLFKKFPDYMFIGIYLQKNNQLPVKIIFLFLVFLWQPNFRNALNAQKYIQSHVLCWPNFYVYWNLVFDRFCKIFSFFLFKYYFQMTKKCFSFNLKNKTNIFHLFFLGSLTYKIKITTFTLPCSQLLVLDFMHL